MPTHFTLFDADGRDRELPTLDSGAIASVGANQLLWIDIEGDDAAEHGRVLALLDLPPALRFALGKSDRDTFRPRLDLYAPCFYLNVQAVQERTPTPGDTFRGQRLLAEAGDSDTDRLLSFRLVMVHFVVWEGIVLTLHSEPAEFLASFDRRIKGDTHLGTLDSPSFVGALLNWHVSGYFRALEALETEVDRIDDAALRQSRTREERGLLQQMVRVRRRLALVRRALQPHREAYATLSRPLFAPFVSEQATVTLGMVTERLERAIEATENARELVLGSFDIFTTQTAMRTNEVVKTLTMISAVLLPAGVLLNLAVLILRTPVYDAGRLGFWILMAVMVTISVAFVVVARNRRWL